MPSRKPKPRASDGKSPASAESVLEHADALYRAALECVHQHDRAARVLERSVVELEEQSVIDLCQSCDETLTRLVEAYAKALAETAPEGAPEWWRRANRLWFAAREYSGRRERADVDSRRRGPGSPEHFGTLQLEYELAASSLLALRLACEEYQTVRPNA